MSKSFAGVLAREGSSGVAKADTSDSTGAPHIPHTVCLAASARKSRREWLFFDMRALGFAVKSNDTRGSLQYPVHRCAFRVAKLRDGYRRRRLPGRINQDRNRPVPLPGFGTDLAVYPAMSVEPINTFELDMPAVSRVSRLREKLERNIRAQFTIYLQVFAGTGVRLGLQAVYFFILANPLSLRDMGLFASTSSTGIMIGCFSGLGFSSFAFRAAAGKRRALGGHLATFYVSWLISMPLCLAASLPVFYLLFTTSLSLTAFLLIISVETGTWRIVEMIHQVNNGLGRYGSASLGLRLRPALRPPGAISFMASGRHDVETWSIVYVLFNIAAMVLAVAVYQPRIKLRWRPSLVFGRSS